MKKRKNTFDTGYKLPVIVVVGSLIEIYLYALLKRFNYDDFLIWLTLSLIAFLFLLWAYQIKDQESKKGQEIRNIRAAEIHKDPSLKNYTLYLRSFKYSDKLPIQIQWGVKYPLLSKLLYYKLGMRLNNDLEANLAYALDTTFPLVSIGNTLNIGSGKPVVHKKWQVEFAKLVKYTKTIFIVPFYTESTFWEISTLIKNNLIEICVFIMPPGKKKEWQKSINEYKKIGLLLPEYQKNGLVFTYDSLLKLSWKSTTTLYQIDNLGDDPAIFNKIILQLVNILSKKARHIDLIIEDTNPEVTDNKVLSDESEPVFRTFSLLTCPYCKIKVLITPENKYPCCRRTYAG